MRISGKVNIAVHGVMRRYVAWRYTKKLRQISTIVPNVFENRDIAFEKEYERYWRRLLPYVNPKWGSFYAGVSGIKDVRFVPEDVFYCVMERCLNNCSGAGGYIEDKCDVNFYIPAPFRPLTILAYDRGTFFDGDFNPVSSFSAQEILDDYSGDVIGKPSVGTSGGHGVACFRQNRGKRKINGDIELTVNYIMGNFEGFIVQERIQQNTIISRYNPESLNTCRLVTFRRPWSGKVNVIAGMLRIGGSNSPVDNVTSGGVCIDIDSKGRLAEKCYDYRFRSHDRHPRSGIKFAGEEIPNFRQMSNAVCSVAQKIPGFNILGFDVVSDVNNCIKIIEINATSISMKVQTRQPLFGDETEQVVEWCMAHRKFDSFVHFRTWY